MDTDILYLLFCAGSVLVMVLFWTYYILDVRRNPDRKSGTTNLPGKARKAMASSSSILTARYFSALAVSQGWSKV